MLNLKKDGKLTPPTNKIVSIDDEIQNDSHDYHATMEQQYKVKFMHECGQSQFNWPVHSDECWYNSVL